MTKMTGREKWDWPSPPASEILKFKRGYGGRRYSKIAKDVMVMSQVGQKVTQRMMEVNIRTW